MKELIIREKESKIRALLLPFSAKGPPNIDPIIAPIMTSEDIVELNMSLSERNLSKIWMNYSNKV